MFSHLKTTYTSRCHYVHINLNHALIWWWLMMPVLQSTTTSITFLLSYKLRHPNKSTGWSYQFSTQESQFSHAICVFNQTEIVQEDWPTCTTSRFKMCSSFLALHKKHNYCLTAGVCAAIWWQQCLFPFAFPIHIMKHNGTAKATTENNCILVVICHRHYIYNVLLFVWGFLSPDGFP